MTLCTTSCSASLALHFLNNYTILSSSVIHNLILMTLFQYGDTAVLVAVTSKTEAIPNAQFLPLTVSIRLKI